MDSALPDALFVPSFPATRENLTHYYVMVIGDKQVAIGEAEHVRQIEPSTWEAHVVKWGVNPQTKELDPEITLDVVWMTVAGPTFVVIPKEDFDR